MEDEEDVWRLAIISFFIFLVDFVVYLSDNPGLDWEPYWMTAYLPLFLFLPFASTTYIRSAAMTVILFCEGETCWIAVDDLFCFQYPFLDIV